MASFIERAIAAVAPRRAASRAAARVATKFLWRQYDAARASRPTWGWLAGSTSANAEIYGGLLTLRNRARDLVRNNPHAAKALRVLTNNSVGTGIDAQARTPDAQLNAKIDALWKRFMAECDFGGQLDLGGIQRLAVRAMLEGGETICRLRPDPDRRLAVPLTLQLLEGDYLDHRRNGETETGRLHQGVEFDRNGKRAAYYLFREHPGDAPFAIPQSYASDRIPAAAVIHLYEVLRIGQIRGVPWFTPGMVKARELDTYEEAELVRKRIEACVAAIVMGADDEEEQKIAPTVTDAAGNQVEQFEPGLIAYARGTKDIRFTAPAQNGSYSQYKRSQLMTIAAAWDMTYELLSGDLSQTNYSSIKAGLNEFRRSVEVLQWLTFVPMFLGPVWRAFIDFAVLAGKLPQATPYDVEFTTPKFESVDPVKDTAGDIAAVRALLMAPQEAIRRRGYDPSRVLADAKAWHEALEAAAIVSDADAAQTAKPGAATPKGQEGGEPSEVVEKPAAGDEVTAP